jgi:hypothetical protein
MPVASAANASYLQVCAMLASPDNCVPYCHFRRRRISCAVVMYRVALFVHKCMKIADAAAVAAARQQPR